MADGTYYVGRTELLKWINSTLGLRLNKIEETSSGAVVCQLLDVVHRGQVNLGKVNFNAKTEYDSINNYKVLQAAFTKLGIDKEVPVQSLIKGKPLDNMEFMQWFKSYFDGQLNGQDIEYDGPARRQMTKGGAVRSSGGIKSNPRSSVMAPSSQSSARRSGGGDSIPYTSSTPTKPKLASQHHGGSDDGRVQELLRQIDDLTYRMNDMQRAHEEEVAGKEEQIQGVISEKDFYYSKLRAIEILTQNEDLKASSQYPIEIQALLSNQRSILTETFAKTFHDYQQRFYSYDQPQRRQSTAVESQGLASKIEYGPHNAQFNVTNNPVAWISSPAKQTLRNMQNQVLDRSNHAYDGQYEQCSQTNKSFLHMSQVLEKKLLQTHMNQMGEGSSQQMDRFFNDIRQSMCCMDVSAPARRTKYSSHSQLKTLSEHEDRITRTPNSIREVSKLFCSVDGLFKQESRRPSVRTATRNALHISIDNTDCFRPAVNSVNIARNALDVKVHSAGLKTCISPAQESSGQDQFQDVDKCSPMQQCLSDKRCLNSEAQSESDQNCTQGRYGYGRYSSVDSKQCTVDEDARQQCGSSDCHSSQARQHRYKETQDEEQRARYPSNRNTSSDSESSCDSFSDCFHRVGSSSMQSSITQTSKQCPNVTNDKEYSSMRESQFQNSQSCQRGGVQVPPLPLQRSLQLQRSDGSAKKTSRQSNNVADDAGVQYGNISQQPSETIKQVWEVDVKPISASIDMQLQQSQMFSTPYNFDQMRNSTQPTHPTLLNSQLQKVPNIIPVRCSSSGFRMRVSHNYRDTYGTEVLCRNSRMDASQQTGQRATVRESHLRRCNIIRDMCDDGDEFVDYTIPESPLNVDEQQQGTWFRMSVEPSQYCAMQSSRAQLGCNGQAHQGGVKVASKAGGIKSSQVKKGKEEQGAVRNVKQAACRGSGYGRGRGRYGQGTNRASTSVSSKPCSGVAARSTLKSSTAPCNGSKNTGNKLQQRKAQPTSVARGKATNSNARTASSNRATNAIGSVGLQFKKGGGGMRQSKNIRQSISKNVARTACGVQSHRRGVANRANQMYQSALQQAQQSGKGGKSKTAVWNREPDIPPRGLTRYTSSKRITNIA